MSEAGYQGVWGSLKGKVWISIVFTHITWGCLVQIKTSRTNHRSLTQYFQNGLESSCLFWQSKWGIPCSWYLHLLQNASVKAGVLWRLSGIDRGATRNPASDLELIAQKLGLLKNLYNKVNNKGVTSAPLCQVLKHPNFWAICTPKVVLKSAICALRLLPTMCMGI